MSGMTYEWYCPHCGKKQNGADRRRDVFTMYEGMASRHYRLCTECMDKLHAWLEGGE